jgi:hypothetical protein
MQVRIVHYTINNCSKCGYRTNDNGIEGPSVWCCHPSNKKEKQITGNNLSKSFPSWCPLPIKKLKRKKNHES